MIKSEYDGLFSCLNIIYCLIIFLYNFANYQKYIFFCELQFVIPLIFGGYEKKERRNSKLQLDIRVRSTEKLLETRHITTYLPRQGHK